MNQTFFQNSLCGRISSVGRRFSKFHALQADIDRIDWEIDALVYELYGLTEEEIRIVEGGEG
ncbi:hypothetical protein [Algoriphagus confluentis]|uniref:Restriction endonuclease n=1 Tax=Algoriphagus confluentis TaxID=1697556 RepID=A0ABQ6PPM7_9BACT|nr:hypothetical protein Aconfl_25440 [Algoriphagus confluentis]